MGNSKPNYQTIDFINLGDDRVLRAIKQFRAMMKLHCQTVDINLKNIKRKEEHLSFLRTKILNETGVKLPPFFNKFDYSEFSKSFLTYNTFELMEQLSTFNSQENLTGENGVGEELRKAVKLILNKHERHHSWLQHYVDTLYGVFRDFDVIFKACCYDYVGRSYLDIVRAFEEDGVEIDFNHYDHDKLFKEHQEYLEDMYLISFGRDNIRRNDIKLYLSLKDILGEPFENEVLTERLLNPFQKPQTIVDFYWLEELYYLVTVAYGVSPVFCRTQNNHILNLLDEDLIKV